MSKRARLFAVAAGTAAAFALVPGAAAFASTPSAAPSTKAAACDKTPWEAKVQGRPAFHAGAASGEYLWHDANGFHLRVTHHGKEKIVYSGQVTASAPMRMDKVKLEGKDFAVLSANRETLTFKFYNFGHVDGVDFHTDCASTLRVNFAHANGHEMSNTRVYLGAKSAHPTKVPFTVHRIVPKPTPAS